MVRLGICSTLSVLISFVGGASPSFGRDGATPTERTQLADEYLEFARERPPLYQGAPVTHITPQFNKVTYAIESSMLDTTVIPTHLNQGSQVPQSLSVEGYSIEPYVALSLKRVGLGFNVEAGQRRVEYLEGGTGEVASQKSVVGYRGLGVFGFVKLLDDKKVTSTLVLGGKNISATHDVGGVAYATQGAYGKTYHYSVPGYEAGLNFGLHLVKQFTVIPWFNYTHLDVSQVQSYADKEQGSAGDVLDEDVQLLWKAKPDYSYGIDFAVRLDRFEVRVGGLLGLLVSTGPHSEQVTDRSYSVSFAWDHDG